MVMVSNQRNRVSNSFNSPNFLVTPFLTLDVSEAEFESVVQIPLLTLVAHMWTEF